jgi:hypothetical protein
MLHLQPVLLIVLIEALWPPNLPVLRDGRLLPLSLLRSTASCLSPRCRRV